MAKHRLINCEFINAGSFKVGTSNKAKLLYLLILANADDKGFCDNTIDLINALERNDLEFENSISMELIQNTYKNALIELVEKGYLYEFKDNHNNIVYLVRHWFFHNKLVRGLWTNYRNFLNEVYLDNNEYVRGKKPLKEDKLKETNVNQDKNKLKEEWDNLFDQEEKPKDNDDNSLPFE